MPTDKDRLDWLERQYVEVRLPAFCGSFSAFQVGPEGDEEFPEPSRIRELIDKQIERHQ